MSWRIPAAKRREYLRDPNKHVFSDQEVKLEPKDKRAPRLTDQEQVERMTELLQLRRKHAADIYNEQHLKKTGEPGDATVDDDIDLSTATAIEIKRRILADDFERWDTYTRVNAPMWDYWLSETVNVAELRDAFELLQAAFNGSGGNRDAALHLLSDGMSRFALDESVYDARYPPPKPT